LAAKISTTPMGHGQSLDLITGVSQLLIWDIVSWHAQLAVDYHLFEHEVLLLGDKMSVIPIDSQKHDSWNIFSCGVEPFLINIYVIEESLKCGIICLAYPSCCYLDLVHLPTSIQVWAMPEYARTFIQHWTTGEGKSIRLRLPIHIEFGTINEEIKQIT
ncbi:hypothetical protein ACJX0J_019565, partial [Zea mays]